MQFCAISLPYKKYLPNLLGKVPPQVLKELEHQARQNLSTINFTAAFAKTSSVNTTMEKCQHSLKSTFKKVKTQILKGANPEKAAGVVMTLPVIILKCSCLPK